MATWALLNLASGAAAASDLAWPDAAAPEAIEAHVEAAL
jgi:hypothetical protein